MELRIVIWSRDIESGGHCLRGEIRNLEHIQDEAQTTVSWCFADGMVVCMIMELRKPPLAHTVPLRYLFQELYASRFQESMRPCGPLCGVSEATLSALTCSSPVPGYLFACKTITHSFVTQQSRTHSPWWWQSRLDLVTEQQQNRMIIESLGDAFIPSQLLFSLSPWCFGGWTIPSILLSDTVVSHSVSE